MDIIPTPSQTVGPYFRIGLTEKYSKPGIAGPLAQGERLKLAIRVFDGDNEPVNDSMVEIWQADAAGKYNHPEDQQTQAADPHCDGFGRMGTDEDGRCEFETIRPGRVPGPGNSLQAPHLNIAIFARGMLKQFYTRIYFAGDPANSQDPVLALVPADRRDTLMAQPDPAQPGLWRFDFHLQGDKETVFFDV
ncbi:MAG TPA: protocatechuate 3,4-dioxygenase subunit alpha [Terriglobales bacterium]|nr:protocatechuate 3,4-dioxygenase subunit alpha [Terriglobales bacterium]